MHMRQKREKRVHLLLSNDEWNMLLTLCDENGVNVSAMIRQLIRQEIAKFQDH